MCGLHPNYLFIPFIVKFQIYSLGAMVVTVFESLALYFLAFLLQSVSPRLEVLLPPVSLPCVQFREHFALHSPSQNRADFEVSPFPLNSTITTYS